MGDPAIDPDAFLRQGTWDRAALSEVLRLATAGWTMPGSAARAPLLPDDTVAIVTGQQPAVGGGPLYSLVKTAHAIAIARALGPRAVPVFWCASEDHDLGEAGHADLLTRDGRIQRFAGDLGPGRASLRFRPTASWWNGLVEHARRHLGDGLGTGWLLSHAPGADESTGAWTCRLLNDLFATYRLLCCEGHHLRPLWTAAMQRALTAWPLDELAALRQRLLSEGADDAFGDLPAAPVFADRADGRVALSAAEAIALGRRDPTVLSPGAALRPILQQAALPAVAYVGGPGELAYHRFITPLYAALGVPAPVLIPRCSLTLIPSWVRRGCERWQVGPDALAGPAPATGGNTTTLSGLDAALAALAAQPVPPAQQRRMQAGIIRLRRERDRLAASLARGDRRVTERPAWGALQGWLHPRGGRQERTLSLFQAVWEFGPGIADRLVEAAAASAPGVHGWVDLR